MLNIFRKKLPGCDMLFAKYFGPWYNKEDRPTITRPDMYVISDYEGQPLHLNKIQILSPDLPEKNRKQIQTMADAALQDYQDIIQSDKLDFQVLDAVDKHFDRKEIAGIIKRSDPKDFSNEYLISRESSTTNYQNGISTNKCFQKLHMKTSRGG